MMAITKSEPARLPQKVMNQWRSVFKGEMRRWRQAIVVSCAV
jgi:hypothetical protein